MIRIEDSVEVESTPDAAFAFVTRVEGYPAWLPGVVRAEPLEGAGTTAGAGATAGGAGDGAVSRAGTEGGAAGEGIAGDGAAGTIRPGSRFRLISSGPGGIEIVSTGSVEALDPPRTITIAASSGFFGLTATCTIEPLGEARSRICVRAAIEPRGLATLAAGRIEQELRAAVPDTLRRLREAVEAGPAG
jgi:carbon monoxide dehydrogenase subunit G